jgi:glycosyltransferase involved in cell wall biosynthesis
VRLLYVVRLFSGLEEGLLDGAWRPSGVPTIYRMIEALDGSDHHVRFVFTCKDHGSRWRHRGNRTFPVDGLRNPVTVLAGGNTLPRFLGRARGYLREVRQAWPIWSLRREFRPDVIYFDRVNVFQAALAARYSEIPVVWRVMGIPPPMHAVLNDADPVSRITRWAYRSPFAKVICSRDGSGGEAWMKRALAPSTPCKMMINGADDQPETKLDPDIAGQLPAGRTLVLFVARLVENKGCMTFMEGFLDALAQEPEGLHAVIAGGGPFAEPMRAAAAERGALDQITFFGQVAHDQIAALHRRCDIYVSLNPMGNLTNANLEAMRCGDCMIIPAAQPDSGVDTDTAELVPESAVMRVASPEDRAGLTDALVRLHGAPGERDRRAARTQELANQLIPSWAERISGEVAMLEQISTMPRQSF